MTVTDIDFAILDAIGRIHNEVLTFILKIFTTAADNGYLWIGVCLLLIIIPRTRKTGLYAAAALAFVFILNDIVIKNLVTRDRPFIQRGGVELLIKPPGGYSFPSGHSAASFATATAIFIKSRRLGILCLIAAFIIAFSRLYFFVHFPTDVLVGSLLGAVGAIAVCAVIDKLISKQNAQCPPTEE